MSSHLLAAKSVYSILAALSAAGIACNFTLLVVTIRSRSLRSPCNILIGSCALFDVLHQLGTFTMGSQIYMDDTMHSWSCSIIMYLPSMGVVAGSFAVLSIGIDRFLSIAMPNWYRGVNVKSYLAVHFLAITIYCVYNAFLMIHFYREQDLICSPPSVYHDDAVALWAGCSALINVAAFTVYMLTWRLIRAQAANLELDKQHRIFRTIVLVTVFDLSGWAITQTLVAAQNFMELTDAARLSYVCFAALFVHLGIAVKLLVYYFTSTEYRHAINRRLGHRSVSQISRSLSHPQSTTKR